jgi:uncharacterized membrane protein
VVDLPIEDVIVQFAVVITAALAAWLTGWKSGYTGMDRLAMTGLSIPQAAATLGVLISSLPNTLQMKSSVGQRTRADDGRCSSPVPL